MALLVFSGISFQLLLGNSKGPNSELCVLDSYVDETWKVLTMVSSDFWCRSSIPEEGNQVDEIEQMVLGAEFACFVTSWDRTVMWKWHD